MTGGEEKRRHLRCPLIAEIEYMSDSPLISARISDISLGGLFIDTVNALDLGKEVKFKFTLPGDKEGRVIAGKGVVTWTQQTVGMGLRFTHMHREDWERIRAFVEHSS